MLAHRYYVPGKITRKPYSALELAGRDIYIREGCYTCHSQMVRSLPQDIIRFGERSKPEDFIFDHPFQWGSRRIGPDLAHVGGKYPNSWHFYHMMDPRRITPNSLMPSYPQMYRDKINFSNLVKKLTVMKNLGVPYAPNDVARAAENAEAQAKVIADELRSQGVTGNLDDKEILAVIAYLQSMSSKG